MSRGLNYRQKYLVLTEKYKGICYENASGKETGFGQNSPDFDSRDKKNWLSRYSLSKSIEYKEASLLSKHINTLYSLLKRIAIQDLYMFVSLFLTRYLIIIMIIIIIIIIIIFK